MPKQNKIKIKIASQQESQLKRSLKEQKNKPKTKIKQKRTKIVESNDKCNTIVIKSPLSVDSKNSGSTKSELIREKVRKYSVLSFLKHVSHVPIKISHQRDF